MLLYPTIQELTKDEYNRFQLVIAVAKCTRMVTDEYFNKAQHIRARMEDEERPPLRAEATDSDEENLMTVAVRRIRSGEYKITVSNEGE